MLIEDTDQMSFIRSKTSFLGYPRKEAILLLQAQDSEVIPKERFSRARF